MGVLVRCGGGSCLSCLVLVPTLAGAVYDQLDCRLRQLAFTYGQQLQPWQGEFATLADALQLQRCPGVPDSAAGSPGLPGGRASSASASSASSSSEAPPGSDAGAGAGASVVYVSAADGSDANGLGTLALPFKTLPRAQEKARALPTPATVFLRGGVYHLQATFALDPRDSGTSFVAYEQEAVTLSGGAPLMLKWAEHTPKAGNRSAVFVAAVDLGAAGFNESGGGAQQGFASLFVGGRRFHPARFPNGERALQLLVPSSR